MEEKRQTERILLAVPIRVSAFAGTEGGFSEETYTVEINREGARIALKHGVEPGDTIRIVNLENMREADFRVVGPSRLEADGITDWGVACLEVDRNVWDIQFSAPLKAPEDAAGALLKCGDCGTQSFCSLRDWEIKVLESGPLQRFCKQCGGPTNWDYVDAKRTVEDVRAPEPPPPPEPPATKLPPGTWTHQRAFKRLSMKLPVMVRDQYGAQELSKTETVSKGGLAVNLGLKLEVGDPVTICCPYTEGGQNLEQKAAVRSRVTFFTGERWIYGFAYVAP